MNELSAYINSKENQTELAKTELVGQIGEAEKIDINFNLLATNNLPLPKIITC